jgi:hypothetical protein
VYWIDSVIFDVYYTVLHVHLYMNYMK